MNDLSAAAQRISAGISTELDGFHSQLQDSYVTLGREFKTIFEDLIESLTFINVAIDAIVNLFRRIATEMVCLSLHGAKTSLSPCSVAL